MASILTNTSAMTALQNLRSINSNLVDTQNQIATGKKISNARDNAAIWAVSKVLESDVSGFKAISDSLNLGQSTLSVGRNAAETVSNLLTELRGNIVAAQEENVDRSKIQSDVESTVEQIKSIVDSARFNGLTLVEGFDDVNILGSLQRNSDGSITAKDIGVARYDLTTARGTIGTGTDDNLTIDETVFISQANDGVAELGLIRASANEAVATFGGATNGEVYSVDIDGQRVSVTFDATVTDGSTATTQNELAAQLAQKVNDLGIEGLTAEVFNPGSDDDMTISNANGYTEFDIEVLVDGAAAAGTFEFADDSLSDEDGQDFTAARTDVRLVGKSEKFEFVEGTSVAEGDSFRFNIGDETFSYVAGPGETIEDVARGLQNAIASSGVEGLTTEVYFDEAETDGSVYWDSSQSATTISKGDRWVLAVNYDNTDTTETIQIGDGTTFFDSASGGTASGGLYGLEGLDVSTDSGAERALTAIDNFINESLDAASSFGSSERRVDLQTDFVGKLIDSLKTGIGALVDADLEAASARLQALQVQQQLGIQSLSIANQAPQSILSLFR